MVKSNPVDFTHPISRDFQSHLPFPRRSQATP
jgi:hypothetical protein